MATEEAFPQVSRWLSHIEGKRSETTLQTYRSDIRQFRQWLQEEVGKDRMADVSTSDIENYLASLGDQGYAPNTVRSRWIAIQSFFTWLADQHLNPTEPFELDKDDWANPTEWVDARDIKALQGGTMKEEKRRKEGESVVLTDEEVRDLAEHVPVPETRNRLIIYLMYETGMREVEARNVRIQDIDIDAGTVQIEDNKTGGYRTGTFGATVKDLLRTWLFDGRRDAFASAADSDYLFVSRKSEQMGRGTINDMLKTAADAAGIQESLGEDMSGQTRSRITSHALRRSFAERCRESGMDLRSIQMALGHSKITTTEEYLGLGDKEVTGELRKHAPRLD